MLIRSQALNRDLAKYIVVMTPTIRPPKFPNSEGDLNPTMTYTPMNQQTSRLVWNTRGLTMIILNGTLKSSSLITILDLLLYLKLK